MHLLRHRPIPRTTGSLGLHKVGFCSR
jgi:hypothetical protein